jgi:hypothetical protein
MTDTTEQTDDQPVEVKNTATKPSVGNVLGRVVIFLGLAVLVWLVFGQIASRFLFTPQETTISAPPPVDNSAMENRVAALESKIKVLEDVIAATPSAPPPPPPPPPALEPLEARIAALETSANTAPPGIPEETLTQLKTELTEINARAERRLAMISALTELRFAAERGAPFGKSLIALEPLTAGNVDAEKALAILKPSAETGLPTLQTLQERFSQLVPRMLAVAEDKTTLAGNLKSLVRIRKVGEAQPGATDEAVIARAEVKLAKGDLAACLKELIQLSSPAAALAEDWSIAARQSISGAEALQALSTALLQGTP